MTCAAIALGSNLGDRLDYLRAGVRGLESLGEVTAVSRLYETEPVGGPAQGRYLNACALLETDLPPADLLDALLEIERESSRVRDVKWGPRTLDLDLIVYGGEHLDLPDLEVPHPRAHLRSFVVGPLADVWPDSTLADDRTTREVLDDVGTKGLVTWQGDWRTEVPNMGGRARAWVGAQVALFAAWLAVLVAVDRSPPSPVTLAIGLTLAVAGVAVLEFARRALGAELTPYPQPREGARLIDSGVYGLVRHPIYLGVVALFAGVSTAAGSVPSALVVLVLGVFFVAKSGAEERALMIGVRGYADYRERVRFRFIPYLL